MKTKARVFKKFVNGTDFLFYLFIFYLFIFIVHTSQIEGFC